MPEASIHVFDNRSTRIDAGKLQSSVGWLLAALLLAAYVAMLRRYSVNFPWADDFPRSSPRLTTFTTSRRCGES